ncbi:MAG: hypothetical protein K2K81_08060 [Muribaculaceae bacterium]|nr:hypothetical protein [Muribaculaceae bacterium]
MKQFILPTLLCMSAFTMSAELPPASPSEVKLSFEVVNGKGVIKGQVTAPTTSNDYVNAQTLTERISVMTVTRSCWSLGGDDVVVAKFEQVIPGRTYSFEDNDLPEYGYSYNYKAVALNDEGAGGYGTSEYIFAGVKPSTPEFVSVTVGDQGKPPVSLVIKGTDLNEDGEPLGMPLTALTLSYSGDDDYTSNEITKIENPEPGKEYSVNFDAQEGMTYEFQLISECAFGSSETKTYSLYVGADSPASPADVKALPKDSGALISWTAPTEGRHGGWLDPATIRYKVERVISYFDKTLLAEDLEECEFFDPCEDLTTLTSLSYAVTAYNAMGESTDASSETVTVGPMASLPFIEHFNAGSGYSPTPDNIWTYEPDDYDWSFSRSKYYSGGANGVLGDDKKEDGYAYCDDSYNSGDADRLMISTPINMSDAKYPVLSFWYLSRPDLDNKLIAGYREDGEDRMVLEVGISDDFAANAEEGGEYVWVNRYVALPEVAGKSASIVFNASRKATGEYGVLCIDEVLLDDYPTVETFSTEIKDGEGVIKWVAPANHSGEPTSYDVELDGEAMSGVTTPELPVKDMEDKDYVLKVRPVYGKIPSCWSNEYVFNPLTTGISTIMATEGETIYYDLTGMPRSTFEKGEILIRRTVAADGTVRTEKVRM